MDIHFDGSYQTGSTEEHRLEIRTADDSPNIFSPNREVKTTPKDGTASLLKPIDSFYADSIQAAMIPPWCE